MKSYFKHKMRTKRPEVIAGIIIFGIIIITALAILFGYVIMWLWNWLMPEIFGLTTITYWQAVGIFILAKILFGGIGNGGDKDHKKCKKEEGSSKRDFSKWELYESYWQEEGEQAYQEYVIRRGFPSTKETEVPPTE
jgi:hypothetical protein